jgi:hypothetical protein
VRRTGSNVCGCDHGICGHVRPQRRPTNDRIAMMMTTKPTR